MPIRSSVAALAAGVIVLAGAAAAARQEPVVGLPCEDCEAVFQGLPASLSPTARLAPPGEPGAPMTITGLVLGADGAPRPGVVVYAYQTDAKGIYPPPAARTGGLSDRHGRLRGWAVSGADGRYTFETIRPGSYPSRDTPEHVHMHVIERGCATYYIDDVMFTDDPLLTPSLRARQPGRGGPAMVTPVQRDGRWRVTRDIRLGERIPGHPGCR
jgi:protocatechuate 3,4-dioxygenase beta subunit